MRKAEPGKSGFRLIFLVKMLLGVLFLCLAAIIVWGAVR